MRHWRFRLRHWHFIKCRIVTNIFATYFSRLLPKRWYHENRVMEWKYSKKIWKVITSIVNKNRHHKENMSIFILQLWNLLKCPGNLLKCQWCSQLHHWHFQHHWHFMVGIWFICHILNFLCYHVNVCDLPYLNVIYHIGAHFGQTQTRQNDSRQTKVLESRHNYIPHCSRNIYNLVSFAHKCGQSDQSCEM